MAKLEEIAGFAVKKTGIFHNQTSYYKNKMKKTSKIAEGLDKQVKNCIKKFFLNSLSSLSLFLNLLGFTAPFRTKKLAAR